MLIDVGHAKGRMYHVFLNDHGERCTEYEKFEPSIFEYSNENTGWTDVNGKSVKEVKVKSIGSYTDQWKDVYNHE